MQIDFEEGEEVLATNWINQINEKKDCIIVEKNKQKETNHERKERFNVKVKIERIQHNVCYIMIIENIGTDEIHRISRNIHSEL